MILAQRGGAAPYTFRLVAPDGTPFVRTEIFDNPWEDWGRFADLNRVNPYGHWTAQVDNGPTFSWTLIAPPVRTITSWITAPNPPVAGRPFVLSINGSNLDVSNEQIDIVGHYSVTIPKSALSVNTATAVSASLTVPYADNYSVQLRSTTPFSLIVVAPVPVLTQLSISPSPPVARRQLTLTVTGSDLISTATLLVSGPGCGPCRASMTGPATATSAIGTFTPNYSGSYTVTVQNTEGTALSNTLSFTVTTVIPTLTTAQTNPRSPVPGQAVTLTALGDDFDPPTAEMVITGPGCNAGCLIANDALTFKVWTTLDGPFTASATGTYAVAVRNGRSGALSNPASFTIGGAPPPAITSLSTSPSPPLFGRAFTLTLGGSGFEPTTADVLVDGPGCSQCTIPNAALTGKSSTSLSGSLTVATSGLYNVRVQNRSGSLSNPSALTVAPPIPLLTSFTTSPSPPIQLQAFQLTLSGDGFDPATARVVVTGMGCPCVIDHGAVTVVGQKTLVGTMTLDNAGSFLLSVQNGTGGTPSASLTLNVQSATPRITSLTATPANPVPGQPILLTLAGTGVELSSASILVYGTGCDPCAIAGNAITSRTQTTLAGLITLASPGTFTVGVQTAAGIVRSSLSFVVGATAPSITALTTTPSAPLAGRPFTITIAGSGFDPLSAFVAVSGPGCTPCVLGNPDLTTKTATTLSGTLTLNGSGVFQVSVQNGSGAIPSNSRPLTLGVPTPTITGLATLPTPAIPGELFTLTVTGTDFDPATAQIVITGAGCAPCSIAPSALTLRTATSLAGSATLSAGVYTVSVRNGSGLQSESLPLVVGGTQPVIDRGGIVSAAGFQPALARGAVASVFGSNLALAVVSAGETPLPRNLGGVRVQVEGVDAPLFYISPNQINFQVPYESPLHGDVSVRVIRDGVASQPMTVSLQPYAPGLFTYRGPDGSVVPIATRADGSLVTADHPATSGDELVLWGTGIGDLTNTPQSGTVAPYSEARMPPTITIGGTPVELRFAGLTPGAIGLAQFNIHLPDSGFAGPEAELVIRFGQIASSPVSLAVESH